MTGAAAAAAVLSELGVLARGLCADRTLTVASDKRAHFDAGRHLIGIDPALARRPGYARGILAHECGHVLVSRYFLWKPPIARAELWFRLLNALEDPRVDAWMMRRYPGSRAWFEASAHDVALMAKSPPSSAVLQFLFGTTTGIGECRFGEHRFDAVVVDALSRTKDARRLYIETVPDPRIARDTCMTEPMVHDFARRAWEIARDEILPVLLGLADLDAARIATHAAGLSDPEAALSDGDPIRRRATVGTALAEVPGDDARLATAKGQDQRLRFLAEEALDEFLAARGQALDLPPVPLGPTTGSDEVKSVVEAKGDTKRRHVQTQPEIREQIAALSKTLERVLAERQLMRWRSGFRSGPVADVGRLMRFDADRRDDRVWRRKRPVEACEAVVGLLVDLSGSMTRDGKIAAAIGGTLLVVEAAARVGIATIIDGFQDELIPIAAFGEGPTPEVRRRIDEMALEANDRRPGGHNQAQWNDDGPCLAAFARKLLRCGPGSKLLIVVSDGGPAGRHSDDADLRRTIAQLSRARGLDLVGVGIGPGTDHVTSFYPNAIANVPIESLGAELSRLLLTRLRRR